MAQIPYRANLSSSSIPFVSVFQGRTVIVPGQDQNYLPSSIGSNIPGEDNRDRGIPQAYYAHNVMPSAQGLASIGYKIQAAPISAGLALLSKRLAIRDAADNFCFLSQGSDGHTYILGSSGVWKQTIADVAGYANGLITSAYVAGITYIYFQGATDPCRQYNFATNNLDIVTLTGIMSGVIGLTAAAGYLIAWSLTAVAWSSTILASDFTPSLTTGAGSGGVEGAKGGITICIPILNGFIVYTVENSVAAIFSGNARYPFNFREIVGSGGCSSLQLVGFDSDSGAHYAYTTSGLQQVSATQTQTVFGDATDFIAGKLFEDFNETTLIFTQTPLVTLMLKQIQTIADRYLIISYGLSELTHAIVYDLVNKRWGKLKITHVECFEWHVLADPNTELPRESIAFLQKDGTIQTVSFAIADEDSSGVLLVGKYQLLRSRRVTLDSVGADSVYPSLSADCYDLTTYDGKTFQTPIAGYLQTNSAYYREWRFRVTGLNHSLLFIGAFYLSSLILNFHLSGRR